ncbi:hypothetical protein, partial [Klebsiella aerogenes]|uniref:hypothetical protein n=1 Tax=Klebsiella aerogenes TaxID=548 RepID=UPI0019546F0E
GSWSSIALAMGSVRRAARAIQEEVATESVDVLAPSASQYGEWTLDAVLRDAEGVPPVEKPLE